MLPPSATLLKVPLVLQVPPPHGFTLILLLQGTDTVVVLPIAPRTPLPPLSAVETLTHASVVGSSMSVAAVPALQAVARVVVWVTGSGGVLKEPRISG